MTKIAIIGSGFAGMSAASYLAKAGMEVHLFEKNDQPGGRASMFEAEGFKFDMGPSWYWMPEIFEKYFQDFGRERHDFYELERLDPSYQVIFHDGLVEMPASVERLVKRFEEIETGSGPKLRKFLKEAGLKYQIAMSKMVYKPGLKLSELFDLDIIKSLSSMHLLTSMKKYVRKEFKHPWLRQILEFPVLFLGGQAKDIPALYSLMNYADLQLGTWYPKGGMHEISKAFHQVALEQGVQFHFNHEVAEVTKKAGKLSSLSCTNGLQIDFDVLINAGDYQHFDQHILAKKDRQYSKKYWDDRKMAPSSMLYFVGCSKQLPNLLHHNLFFDADFDNHAKAIYENPSWVENPLFYVCCPSKTDETVAPAGKENLFILIPSAPGLKDNQELQESYFREVIGRIEKQTGESIMDHVSYKKCFSIGDFEERYHAFKGNAYGLANVLSQTANLKPKIKSSKFSNLYHAGQLTVPGPGVPPSIISGELVADLILKNQKL